MVAKLLRNDSTTSEKYGRIKDNYLKMIRLLPISQSMLQNIYLFYRKTIFNILGYFQLRGRENLVHVKEVGHND